MIFHATFLHFSNIQFKLFFFFKHSIQFIIRSHFTHKKHQLSQNWPCNFFSDTLSTFLRRIRSGLSPTKGMLSSSNGCTVLAFDYGNYGPSGSLKLAHVGSFHWSLPLRNIWMPLYRNSTCFKFPLLKSVKVYRCSNQTILEMTQWILSGIKLALI